METEITTTTTQSDNRIFNQNVNDLDYLQIGSVSLIITIIVIVLIFASKTGIGGKK